MAPHYVLKSLVSCLLLVPSVSTLPVNTTQPATYDEALATPGNWSATNATDSELLSTRGLPTFAAYYRCLGYAGVPYDADLAFRSKNINCKVGALGHIFATQFDFWLPYNFVIPKCDYGRHVLHEVRGCHNSPTLFRAEKAERCVNGTTSHVVNGSAVQSQNYTKILGTRFHFIESIRFNNMCIHNAIFTATSLDMPCYKKGTHGYRDVKPKKGKWKYPPVKVAKECDLFESDEINDTNKMFETDEINDTNKMFETDEINDTNKMFEIDGVDEMEGTEPMDGEDQSDETDKTESI